MRLILGAGVLALSITGWTAPANAQGKIGLVRGNVLLQNAPGVTERQALLRRETDAFEQQIAKMADSLQKMEKSYRDAEATLSPPQRDARRKAVEDLLEKFRRESDSLRTLAARRQEDVLQPIIDAVNKVLADVRQEDGYSVIWNLDDANGIVAFDKNLDITDAVLARVKRIPPLPTPPSILKEAVKPKIPPVPEPA